MTMTEIHDTAEVLEKISALLWPLLALAALFLLWKPVIRMLDQINNAGGGFEVFGVKVDVGKATEQQQGMIEDLQKQVQLLHKRIDEHHGQPVKGHGAADVAAAAAMLSDTPAGEQRAHPRVLWVDDHPENNALLVASLKRRGFDIDEVLSTDEAVGRFEPGRYNAVISDMGRVKGDDGVTLARLIRARDAAIPFIIFCSARAVATFRDAAVAAGATLVTDSATVVSQSLLALQSD